MFRIRNGRMVIILAACTGALAVVGWLDYITGRDIHFGFFYLLPIIGAALLAGRRAGFAIALLAAAIRTMVDSYSSPPIPNHYLFVWNACIRLCTFATIALLAGSMNRDQGAAPPRKKEETEAGHDDNMSALAPYENRLSIVNKAGRLLWTIIWILLFRPSPEFLDGWRSLLLRCFGARVGRRCRIDPTLRVWAPWNLTIGNDCRIEYHVECYSIDLMVLGNRVVISRHAYLCGASHDPDDVRLRLTHAPIQIADDAWIGARAFIRPGITVGRGAVVTACAVVTRDVDPWVIVGGSPAQFVRKRELPGAEGPGPGAHAEAVAQTSGSQA